MKAVVIQGTNIQVVGVPFDGSLEVVRRLLTLDHPKEVHQQIAASIMVERVTTPIKGLIMLVDEEGRYKQLPINQEAMRFYGDVIYGPAVLTYEEPVYEDGELADLRWVGIPDGFDYELVAETSYQKLLDALEERL